MWTNSQSSQATTPDAWTRPILATPAPLPIGGEGFLDWIADNEVAYKPGCVLYFDEKGQIGVLEEEPVEEKTMPKFRAQWARPWHHLL